MSEWTCYRELLDARGVSLRSLGLLALALGRRDALEAVALLESERSIILGSDAYVEKDGSIEPAYANWYTDPRPAETDESFRARSCSKSRAYIASYSEPPLGRAMFVIVVGTGP